MLDRAFILLYVAVLWTGANIFFDFVDVKSACVCVALGRGKLAIANF